MNNRKGIAPLAVVVTIAVVVLGVLGLIYLPSKLGDKDSGGTDTIATSTTSFTYAGYSFEYPAEGWEASNITYATPAETEEGRAASAIGFSVKSTIGSESREIWLGGRQEPSSCAEYQRRAAEAKKPLETSFKCTDLPIGALVTYDGAIETLAVFDQIVRTLKPIPTSATATKSIDVTCQLARSGEYKLGVSPDPVQVINGGIKEMGLETVYCSDLNDLNSDGKKDALVVFRTTDPLGGTGVFYDVAVVTAPDGRFNNIATKSLPDRSGFGGYEFDSGDMILYLHPWEGKQLPWRKVTYHLQGNKLQEISTQLFDFVYRDDVYGFTMTLPSDWKGMNVTKTSDANGFYFTFVHPTASSRQSVPIGIYSYEVWDKIQKGEIVVSAAPFPAQEIGRNNKWVFSLPPRWIGYAETTYQDEAKVIAGSLIVFNP